MPQLAASLVAARLEGLDEAAVALAGQGLRDVTRIAASDPDLWTQILAGNAPAVREVLAALRGRPRPRSSGALDDLSASTDAPGARGHPGARHRRRQRRARPASRASTAPPPRPTRRCACSSPTSRASSGRLFADIGTIGTNIEEFHLDHGLGQPFGLAEVDVVPAAAAGLATALAERGWRLHG